MARKSQAPRPALPPDLVALYTRVSTDKQAEAQTSQAQLYALHRYVQEHQYRIYAEYCDEGAKGAVPLAERPEGARLLRDAEAGCFGTVLVYRIDRFGRDLFENQGAKMYLHRFGVRVRSVTEAYVDDTEEGEFIFEINGSIAKLEKARNKRRMMDGMERVAREGRFGGVVPFGYMTNAERRLVPSTHPVPGLWHQDGTAVLEHEVVRALFTALAEGSSASEEARRLNRLYADAGTTPAGRLYSNGNRSTRLVPQRWHTARITHMLKASVYSGDASLRQTLERSGRSPSQLTTYPGRETVYREVAEPLVSEALQAAARAQLEANRGAWRLRPRPIRLYLLRGLIRCGGCGAVLQGVMAGNDKVKRPYYQCPDARGRRDRLEVACRGKLVRAAELEGRVWAWCVTRILTPTLATQALEVRAASQADPRHEVEAAMAAVQAKLAATQAARQRVRHSFADNPHVTQEELNADLERLDGQQRAATTELAAARARLAALDELPTRIATVEAMLTSLQARVREIENRETDASDEASMRLVLDIMQPRITVSLPDPTTGAISVSITLPLLTGESLPESGCAESCSAGDRELCTTWTLPGHPPRVPLTAAQEAQLIAERADGAQVQALCQRYQIAVLTCRALLVKAGLGGHHATRFSPALVAEIQAQRRAGMSHPALRAHYGISATHLKRVLKWPAPTGGPIEQSEGRPDAAVVSVGLEAHRDMVGGAANESRLNGREDNTAQCVRGKAG